MIKVREATLADVETIVALGKQLQQSSAYANKNFNDSKAKSVVAMMVNSETDNALVAEDEGQIIGYFLGGLTYEWFSDDLLGFDYSVYVVPAKRDGRAAIKLFKAFEDWAKAKGVVAIHVGITTNINNEGNRRFYHFLGYQDGGRFFEKRL
ncbi:GNAT family N-acetyltransferase [Entomomonas asaccharolytica]|uniref:GNAT family N-acetyltransferase n=1 Tax=Entomomonas asaccharolytica TaxID=2785331 RepID=A0A974NDY9_9GAMM|nr:GNAT family N-acetyltransferase [Entomomonas asaccharolytica]QQP84702.1 GNAT family N-acetyltransferase [Entomomonas asaccharolytica]